MENKDSLDHKLDLVKNLFTGYRKSVFKYLVGKTIGDTALAQDLTSETFLRAIVFIESGRYVDRGKPYPWLKMIARNAFIDHVRKSGKHPTFGFLPGLDGPMSVDPLVSESIVNSEIMEKIKTMVKRLPENQKEVIHLRFYEGKKFREIAVMQGVSINTIVGRMRYALINLRRLIERHDINLDGYRSGN